MGDYHLSSWFFTQYCLGFDKDNNKINELNEDMQDYDSEAEEEEKQQSPVSIYHISLFDLLKLYMRMHLDSIDRKLQTSF